jgi:U6 snRNA-associated Sm-like protein LSm4
MLPSMQIGSHQVLAAEEEGGTLVLNLEAEASDVAKMMEVEAVVAEEGVELVPKVVTKVHAFCNRLHIFC